MERSRRLRRTIVIGLVLILDLLALGIWWARPARLYTDWLRLDSDPKYGPAGLSRAWLSDIPAPWTPIGFASMFEPEDALIGVALVFASILLAVSLVKTWSNRGGIEEGEKPGWRPRILRFRLRTALLAVAVMGLYLGWELESWRLWRTKRYYLGRAQWCAEQEALATVSHRRIEDRLATFEKWTALWPDEGHTPEARAASRAESRESLQRIASHAKLTVDYWARLEKKYLSASEHPRRPVAADPPPPKPEPVPSLDRTAGDAGILATCVEQSRLYPAFSAAHERRAWILATSPDPSPRDGKTAVAEAARACDLTNGKDFRALATLAAAKAETGDFEEAVRLQETAVSILKTQYQKDVGESILKGEQERLARYREVQPYRHKCRDECVMIGLPFVAAKRASGVAAPKTP